jgi:hypothetical protein
MAEILIHPTKDFWEAQREAEKRGHQIVIRGDRLVERVPKPVRRNNRGGPDGPNPAA